MKHDFATDLAYSLDATDDEAINAFYHRVFPHLREIETVKDKTRQRKGIDKVLRFVGGHTVNIDEKKLRDDFGNIVLEEYSNWELKKSGWLARKKHTDYVVYIMMATRRVYLLPFLLLQTAWLKHHKTWIFTYHRSLTENDGYHTSNVPVPAEEVIEAIRLEMFQQLGKRERK